eukprot:1638495-Pyramimonas_sp.AAC.1
MPIPPRHPWAISAGDLGRPWSLTVCISWCDLPPLRSLSAMDSSSRAAVCGDLAQMNWNAARVIRTCVRRGSGGGQEGV